MLNAYLLPTFAPDYRTRYAEASAVLLPLLPRTGEYASVDWTSDEGRIGISNLLNGTWDSRQSNEQWVARALAWQLED